MKVFSTISPVVSLSLKEGFYLPNADAELVARSVSSVLRLTPETEKAYADHLSGGSAFDSHLLSPREISTLKGLSRWCQGYFVKKGSAFVVVDLNAGTTFTFVRKGT